MPDNSTSELGRAVQEVTEKAQLLVREEIALAKAEMTQKVSRLIRGAVVGLVAGVFALAGLIYLLHALSWLIWNILSDSLGSVWLGFLIVAVILFVLGGIGAVIALRSIKKGTPPTPQMAIEEAQLIRQTLTAPHPARPEGAPGAVQAASPARSEVER
jgi:uncharacterized membrane protein YqjE